MKRALLLLLLLAACGSPTPPVGPPPGAGVPSCLANPYASADTPLVFPYGATVTQPSGPRWFQTTLPAAGSYALLITDIPPYDGLGTLFYQDDPSEPVAASYTSDYSPTLRVPFEAEAGVLYFQVDHFLPFSEMTCDTYSLRIEPAA